ncbi:MAG: HAD-IIA family hydrolase [Gemmatimonadales bacterium]|nr:HAD-IIA family hydrolase [Gemmatimonadales bacterium]
MIEPLGKFNPLSGYLIDIEGVLVRDKRYLPIPGSVEWLNHLADGETPFCLVSNNTTDRPQDLIAKLNEVGFQLEIKHLVGVLELAVQWLRVREKKRILWLGSPQLTDFWVEEGFVPNSIEDCQTVVLGVNPRLEVADMDQALGPLLEQGADLLCLHRNSFYLDGKGRRRLGPGAWAGAFEALGGDGQVVTVGKPDEKIYKEALKRLGILPEKALFVSDDPVADLVTAGRMGMRTAFVLSGKYPDHAVLGRLDQEDWPDIVCSCPADMDI